MKRTRTTGRRNQRQRTRKDLLTAAARLLQDGRTPSMDEVAEAALVSRATAYRYFPNIESLLVEAPLDGAVPDPAELFADDEEDDPVRRIDKAEAALHDMCYRNEPQLRAMLIRSLEAAARDPDPASDDPPRRQNRRTGLIEAALAPARGRFTPATHRRLCAALAMIFGTESMIVFQDVLGLDARTARRIKSWAARVLVQAALEESKKKR